MADTLKDTADQVFGEKIDGILAKPLIALRMALKSAYQKREFPREAYDAFVDKMAASLPGDLSGQRKLALEAIEKGEVANPRALDLSSPAKQLLWAATIVHLMNQGDKAVAHNAIWKQLKDTTYARDEMIRVGRVIYSSIQNDDVSISWGQPGSWFYFDPVKNHINLDFFFTLLVGFEFSRAAELHEVGHSQLTTEFPPRMQALREKIDKYTDPKTGNLQLPDSMTPEEQKELALVFKEWELRHDLFNCSEDVCVNQFAANMSDNYPQDFADSMNYVGAMMQGIGELARGEEGEVEVSTHGPEKKTEDEKKKEQESSAENDAALELEKRPLTPDEINAVKAGNISPEIAQKMFNEIARRAVLFSFYKHNGLFNDSDDMWRRLRIFPEDIRGVVNVAGQDSFAYLVDMVAGENGMRATQPAAKDKFYGEQRYRQRVEETAKKRGAIMEEIWDLYLDKFAQVLMKKFEQEVDQQIAKNQSQNGDEGDENDSDQSGQGSGQGQGSGAGSGEGSGQGEGGSDQDPQQGQGGSSGSGGQPGQKQQKGGGGPQPTSEILKNMAGKIKKTPAKSREQENGCGEDADGKNGLGDKQDKDKGKGSGWDQDPAADDKKDSKKVGDLRNQDVINKEKTEEEKEAQKKAAQDLAKNQGNSSSQNAGSGRGVDFAKLAKGDWKDFNRRILELSPVIDAVARALIEIRELQKKRIMQMSKSRNYMADDGDILGRLDRDKIIETKQRQAAHVPLNSDDFKKFKEDQVKTAASTIEFYLMIDGSGSMPGLKLKNGVTAMEAALQSAVITYMACRKAGIDAYIMMWGNPDPLIVARPDSNLREVGEVLETLRNGTHSGTDLAPAIIKSVQEMAAYRSKNGTISGSSHVQIFSDGDIQDSAPAQKALGLIARNSKNMTVDVAILRPPEKENVTAMEQVFNTIIAATHSRMLGVQHGDDPNMVARDLSKTQLRRIRSMEIKTEPDTAKRARLKALAAKLDK